ncbi:hypothetical protein ACOSQ4_018101 [Xanthoceras sorbifolium]
MLAHSQLRVEELEAFCVVLWRLWFKRNREVHVQSSLSIGEVVDWSSAFLSEFQVAAVIPSTAAVQDRAARCWSPPAAGLWKINTDAALDLDRGLVGIGVVVRDHQGLVCGSCAQCIRAHFSPLVAEGTALLRGLLFAVDLGVPLASVESDSAVLFLDRILVLCCMIFSCFFSRFFSPLFVLLLGCARRLPML